MCLSLCHESFPNPRHRWLAKWSLFQRWDFFPWKASSSSPRGRQEQGFPPIGLTDQAFFSQTPSPGCAWGTKEKRTWRKQRITPQILYTAVNAGGFRGPLCLWTTSTSVSTPESHFGGFSGGSRATAFKPSGHSSELPALITLHLHTEILTEIVSTRHPKSVSPPGFPSKETSCSEVTRGACP